MKSTCYRTTIGLLSLMAFSAPAQDPQADLEAKLRRTLGLSSSQQLTIRRDAEDGVTDADFAKLKEQLAAVLDKIKHPRTIARDKNLDIVFQGFRATAADPSKAWLDLTAKPEGWIAALSSDRWSEPEYWKFRQQNLLDWNGKTREHLGEFGPLLGTLRDLTIAEELPTPEAWTRALRERANVKATVKKSGSSKSNSLIEIDFTDAGSPYGKGKIEIFRDPESNDGPGEIAVRLRYETGAKAPQVGNHRFTFNTDGVMGPIRSFRLTPDRMGIAREMEITSQGTVKNEEWLNQPVQPVSKIYDPNQTYHGKTGVELRAMGDTQKEVLVALLDSGVNYNHPGIAFCMAREKNGELKGWDFAEEDALPFDYDRPGLFSGGPNTQHGTGVAGIAGGGNAKVGVVPIRYVGGGAKPDDFETAVKFAHDKGARIINLSFGTKPSLIPEESIAHFPPEIAEGIRNNARVIENYKKVIAKYPDVLFVIAAGNGDENGKGEDNDQIENWPANVSAPNVIAVAATGEPGCLTSFSNYGKKSVHLAAPGEKVTIFCGANETKCASGTSFSAPLVAHTAARMLLAQPKLQPSDLKDILMKTAKEAPELKNKVASGGELDGDRAVQEAKIWLSRSKAKASK